MLPITLGAGVGLGLSYQRCETNISSLSQEIGKIVKVYIPFIYIKS